MHPGLSEIGAGWSSPVARQAHNLKVAGSNPAPATNTNPLSQRDGGFFTIADTQHSRHNMVNDMNHFTQKRKVGKWDFKRDCVDLIRIDGISKSTKETLMAMTRIRQEVN